MPKNNDPFRDFGLLPTGADVPKSIVRAYYSPGRIVGQFIFTGLVLAVGFGAAAAFAAFAPTPLNLLGVMASLAGFGAAAFLGTHNDRRWVEIDGDILRAKHLYIGTVIERRVDEIERLETIFNAVLTAGTAITESIWGRIKGVEIRFRDGRTPLHIMRFDPAMTNAQALIQAVMARMENAGPIESEIVDLDGAPLVRSVFWKGESPKPAADKNRKLLLLLSIILALIFGTCATFIGAEEQDRIDAVSLPPQPIALARLVESGPGPNRHVSVSDFEVGNYIVESKNGIWQRVYIPIFSIAKHVGKQPIEIRAILTNESVRDEEQLKALLRPDAIVGICSAAPRTSFGTTLGPEITNANGAPLNAAWMIDVYSVPPSQGYANAMFWAAVGCFLLGIGCSLIAIVMAMRSH